MNHVRLALVAVAVMELAVPAVANEQVYFRGTYEGSFTSTAIPGTPTAVVAASGTGEATQLGHFCFNFPLIVNLATQSGSGSHTLTAANGDKVFADVIAQSGLLPNGLRQVVEIATITGGTGRFAGATGGFVGERPLDRATGSVIGSFEGTVSSPGSGNP